MLLSLNIVCLKIHWDKRSPLSRELWKIRVKSRCLVVSIEWYLGISRIKVLKICCGERIKTSWGAPRETIVIITIPFLEATHIFKRVSEAHRLLGKSVILRMHFRKSSHLWLYSPIHPLSSECTSLIHRCVCIRGEVVTVLYLHRRLIEVVITRSVRHIIITTPKVLLFNIVDCLGLIFLETRCAGVHLIELGLNPHVAAGVVIRNHTKGMV
jgi:hypothetical protein